MIGSIYQKAKNPNLVFDYPVTYIDDKEKIGLIIRSHNNFQKNYFFLENLSSGRLTKNGEDWKLRSSITQPYFSKYSEIISLSNLENIYQKHIDVFLKTGKVNLYQTFIDAAVEVALRVFSLPAEIPWPQNIIEDMRSSLNSLQAHAWGYGTTEEYLTKTDRLLELKLSLSKLWKKSEEMNNFLNQLGKKYQLSIDSLIDEFIQILQAASETTASSLMWIVWCLSHQQNFYNQLCKSQSNDLIVKFINETLRLYPPLPFITRICLCDIEIQGTKFSKGEVVLLSIVGLHQNPLYWSKPSQFDPNRIEFEQMSLQKGAYIPFLEGPRACGGMRLAMQELQAAVKIILRSTVIHSGNGDPVFDYGVTSRPGEKLELLLEFKKRSQ